MRILFAGGGGQQDTCGLHLRKNVKKPPHAPLGFVVYTDFKTVIVNPDRHTEWLV